MMSSIVVSKNAKYIETENRMMINKSWGWGNGEIQIKE